MTPAPERSWFRFSLRRLVAVTTVCAVLINLSLAQPTKEFASVVRLMIAAGLFVAVTFYLSMQCQGTTAVLGTSTNLLGSMLYHVLESP